MLIDTHAHLNFKDFNKDRDEVIKRALKNNVWLINASSTFNTSKLAVEIAAKYPKGVYASVGLHPIHVKDEEFDISKYKELAKSEKVVAIGETGLDYMYPEQEKQKKVFLQHLALAKELDLPIIFHCRKAHNDLIEILTHFLPSFPSRREGEEKEGGGSRRHLTNYAYAQNVNLRGVVRGVVHCFTGSWQQAQKFLGMGLYLGFNGIIYKMDLTEIIKKTPLGRMLIETDCPFLVPVGVKAERNEPIYVKYVAQRLAEIRGEPFEKIAEITTQNAKKLFSL